MIDYHWLSLKLSHNLITLNPLHSLSFLSNSTSFYQFSVVSFQRARRSQIRRIESDRMGRFSVKLIYLREMQAGKNFPTPNSPASCSESEEWKNYITFSIEVLKDQKSGVEKERERGAQSRSGNETKMEREFISQKEVFCCSCMPSDQQTQNECAAANR